VDGADRRTLVLSQTPANTETTDTEIVHRVVCLFTPQLSLVLIALTHQKNWLTFNGDDPVPDIDSGSLFHFPRHCGIRDLKRFISISHIDTTDFHDTQRNDRRRQNKPDESTKLWERSGRHAVSYTDSIVTIALSCTISEIRRDSGRKSLSTPPFGGPVLRIRLAVSTQCRGVIQTDRQTDTLLR